MIKFYGYDNSNAINHRYKNNSSWKYILSISIFAIVGVLLCIIMLNMYSGYVNRATEKLFCRQNSISGYGCTGVFLSRYGKFLGIPWPMWGMMYFSGILCWLIVFRQDSFNILFCIWIFIGTLTSIALLIILLFFLRGHCRLCMLSHLCNSLIIITSILAFIRYRNTITFQNIRKHISKALLVIFILASIAGWTGMKIYQRQMRYYAGLYETLRTNEYFQRCLYNRQKQRQIKLNKSDHILGSKHADVFIMIYKDFQCPVCYQAWMNVKSVFDELNKEYPDKLAIVVRNWPLSNLCNPYVKINMHPYACLAARAAETVCQLAGNDAFWEYHKLLIKNHNKLDESPYLKFAKKIGISEKNFLEAIKSKAIDKKIKIDIESGEKLHIIGVPSIFINGKYADVSWKNKKLFKELIMSQLNNSKIVNSK